MPASQFDSVWTVTVATRQGRGGLPEVVAIAAKDVLTKYVVQIGVPRLYGVRVPPYPTGPRALLISFDVVTVASCHLARGWRIPERVVDLSVEYRNQTNGGPSDFVGGLAGALLRFGLSTDGAYDTRTTPQAQRGRLEALAALFNAMRPAINLDLALLRGRYLCAVASVQAVGVPLDRYSLNRLKGDWRCIRDRAVDLIDREYGIYGRGGFDFAAFAAWVEHRQIVWPRSALGGLDLGDATLDDMARLYPEVRPVKELRALANFDPRGLNLGHDARNRTPLRPFASVTSRNQPSTKQSVLAGAAWVRHLIRPKPGTALLLIDWAQQEFGIAAALSGDLSMQAAYSTGDPYLALAAVAGAAPIGAVEDCYPGIRDRFKLVALAVQYGMRARGLSRCLATSPIAAQALLNHHKSTYPRFWSWAGSSENDALLEGEQCSVFGWRRIVRPDTNSPSIRNFPMQANGAEMLRLACCLAVERDLKVCATLHDALLIEARLQDVEAAIACAQQAMREASVVVLDGFALRTTVRVIRAPERWTDTRGCTVWRAIEAALAMPRDLRTGATPRARP